MVNRCVEKRKDKHMSDKISMNYLMLMKEKDRLLKEDVHKMAGQTKLLHI